MSRFETLNSKPETSLVLAGGGVAGLGHIAGKLQAMEDFAKPDVDVYDIPILGTSAGSIAGGFAVSGIRYENIDWVQQFSWPQCLLQPNFVEHMLTDIYKSAGKDPEQIFAPNVEATAFRIASLKPWQNRPGLTRLNGGDMTLPQIGAASSSVPGVFAPVRIGHDLYYDGGVGGSASHIKLGRPALNTIVVAPMAQHLMPPVGQMFEKMLINEIDERQTRHGGNVVYLRPNRKVGSMVRNPLNMFDVKIGKEIYKHSYEQMFNILEKHVGNERQVSLADIALSLSMRPEFTTPAYYEGVADRAA